jgi:hypothetical protein
MPGITKARYQQIAASAAQIVTEAGGLTADGLPQSERQPLLKELADKLIATEQVDRRTARSHIARTFRRMRYDSAKEFAEGWGGHRPGAGAPVGNTNASSKDRK